jgi:hypothetical protein
MSGDCGHGWGGHLDGASGPCYRCEVERLRAEQRTLRNAAVTATERAEKAEAERDALLKTLRWLDRWLGHKPMTECTAKIKAAIDAARKEQSK